MNYDSISDPILSPYRIDFKKLKEKDGVIGSVAEMKEKFFAKDKLKLNPHVVMAYYFYNILQGYTDLANTRMILEIGAGSGNLAAVLHHVLNKSTIIIVDLPETICLSMTFLAELFPDAQMLMPHERRTEDFDHYDFIFMTPDQINELLDNSMDLAINSHSFQEMTKRQIEKYFQLIQRCCKSGGYFFTSNRVEKIPSGPAMDKETLEPPQRFSDYPWVDSNEVILYEICRLTRLVQLDNVYIRLERIKK